MEEDDVKKDHVVEKDLLAGIDVGTTGCKCSVYDTKGNLLTEAYREYLSISKKDVQELEPIVVWENVKSVIKECCQKYPEIKAISVTSFGEACVLLDGNDRELANAILYTDKRGKKEIEDLIDEFGASYISRITGLYPSEMYTAAKLAWIKKNKPKMVKKIKQINWFQDYIVYRLSGVSQIDYTLATRSMLFDIERKVWDKRLIEYIGYDIDCFPKLVKSGSIAGDIKVSLKEELGITGEAMIVTGCHDQIAAVIGTGMIKNGEAVDGTGTVECITPVFKLESVNRDKMAQHRFCLVPFMNDLYVTYAFTYAGGALLKWYRDNIAYLEAELAESKGQSPYVYFNEQLDMSVKSKILILPYFAGAATPYMDKNVTGAIVGLTQETKSIDIYRGLMEAVTYEMRLNLELLEEAGVRVKKLRATGGGARSPYWLQLKANVLNRTIQKVDTLQSGSLGCVMLAGLAIGCYKNIEEAIDLFVKPGKQYINNQINVEHNESQYLRYKKMYRAVKSIS